MSDPITLEEYMVDRHLFSRINVMFDDPWLETNPDTLDRMLFIDYGNREVYSKFSGLTDVQLADMLVANFGMAWQSSLKSTVENFDTTRTVTETISQSDVREIENSETSKVSAFNSPALVDDEGKVSTGNEGSELSRTRELLDVTVDGKQKFSQTDLASRRKVVQSILKDVASYLTLSIY